MPWRRDAPFGGFSSTKPWLPLPQDHLERAVDQQDGEPGSVLSRSRRFLRWRAAQPALRTGTIELLDADEPVLALVRAQAGQRLLCVFNLAADVARFASPMALEPAPGHGFESSFEGGIITLPGYGAFFGTIRTDDEHGGGGNG
jgi:alpha-glucosidase